MSIKGTFKIVRGGRHPIKLGRNIGGHPAFSTLKKERDSTGSKKKDHWATCDTFRFLSQAQKSTITCLQNCKEKRCVPKSASSWNPENQQNATEMSTSKQKLCQLLLLLLFLGLPSVRRRYIPIKALTLFSFRTNGSLEFDLETSSFASFFTSFLLYHDCLATHVEQKTSVTQCQSRHKVVVGLPCIL